MHAAEPPRASAAPRRSRARLWLASVGLMTVVAVVVLATLSPTPLDRGYESAIDQLLDTLHMFGVPEWFGYHRLEFSANIAIFVPLGFLIALALPRPGRWLFVLIVPVASASLELTQSLFLAERLASVLDIVANTTGGYIGGILAIMLRAVVARRDQKIVARALWQAGFGR